MNDERKIPNFRRREKATRAFGKCKKYIWYIQESARLLIIS